MLDTLVESPENRPGHKINFQKCIVVLSAPPLFGKSTLGKEMAVYSNLRYLDVDDARQSLFAQTTAPLPSEQEAQAMKASYELNHARAALLLEQNQPIILSATYSRDIYHEMLIDLAKKTGSPLKVFLLEASDESVLRRLEKRQREGNNSNIQTLEDLLGVKNRFIPITGVEVTHINTDRTLLQNTKEVFAELSDLVR